MPSQAWHCAEWYSRLLAAQLPQLMLLAVNVVGGHWLVDPFRSALCPQLFLVLSISNLLPYLFCSARAQMCGV